MYVSPHKPHIHLHAYMISIDFEKINYICTKRINFGLFFKVIYHVSVQFSNISRLCTEFFVAFFQLEINNQRYWYSFAYSQFLFDTAHRLNANWIGAEIDHNVV